MAILGVLGPLSHSQSLVTTPLGKGSLPDVITSAIEHAAVLETLKELEQTQKIELSIISVDSEGIISVDEVKKRFVLKRYWLR